MKPRFTILILIVLTISLFIGCQGKIGQKADDVNKMKIVVGVTKPAVRDIEEYVSFSGRLEGIRDVMVFPQIPGTIDEICVEVGDKVSKDQLLVKMDDENLKQVKAQYEVAKQTYERMKTLYEDSLISPQSFDQSKAAYESTRAAYKQVLDNTELRAPFAGTIVGKYFDEQDVYSPGPRGILQLAVTNKLKLPVDISGVDFGRIKEGMSVKITTNVAPDTVFIGKLENLSPGADPITGLFSGDIILDNKKNHLPVGVFVEAKVVVEEHDDAVVVPRDAIVMDSLIFVYNNGKVFRRVIQTGIVRADSVEIKSGIEPDEIIVCKGALGLKDSARVETMEEVTQ